MRKVLIALLLGLAIAASAAEVTITITIPDARQAEIIAAIDAWRAKQTTVDPADPTKTIPKYPTRAALLKALVIEGIQRILDAEPDAAMLAEQVKIDAAKAAQNALKTAAAQ